MVMKSKEHGARTELDRCMSATLDHMHEQVKEQGLDTDWGEVVVGKVADGWWCWHMVARDENGDPTTEVLATGTIRVKIG
jgi:hypothetical protein